MILVDSGPLIALCDPLDSRHEESVAELQTLSRGAFALCEPVITEAWFSCARLRFGAAWTHS